jgi:hypothetical protein
MGLRHQIGACALATCSVCAAVVPAVALLNGARLDDAQADRLRLDDLQTQPWDVRDIGETRAAVDSSTGIVGAGALRAGPATLNGVGETA